MFVQNIESVFVLLSEICFENGLTEDGVALCDLADKIIPKSQTMTLERYKWLSWMGKQSCFLKITQEKMALVWLKQAQKTTDYNKKMRAFELCIKDSKGTSLELEAIVCFLEWKEKVHNFEKYQRYWNRLNDVLSLESIPNISDGVDKLILNLRAAIVLIVKEKDVNQIQKILQFSIAVLLELLQSIQIESLQITAAEEAKDLPAKGKKETKDVGNKAQTTDLPKELSEWLNYVWPPTIQQCYKECRKQNVFSSNNLPDKVSLVHSLFTLVSCLNAHELYGSVFIFTKFIALISTASKDVKAALAVIEADSLICMGKISESKIAFKTFFKNQLVGVINNSENQVIYPRSLFLQGKILLKYGYSLEAKNSFIKSRNLANCMADEHLLSEIDIFLGFLNIFFGNFVTTKSLITGITGKCTTACMLMDSSLALLFAEAVQLKSVNSENFFFIEAIINQIMHKEHEYSVEDATEALFTLKWIQLRLMPYIHEMTGQQKFKQMVSLFETCASYGDKIGDQSRLKSMQCDYIQGLWSLLKRENDIKNRRQIRNCCIEFIKSLETQLIGREAQFDAFDFQIILNILKVELDHLINPASQVQSKKVDDMLDDFLVNITDPPLQIPDFCCKLLSRIPLNTIPENLSGEFIALKILYEESQLENEGKFYLMDAKY
jgi:hypothetical protein